MDTMPMTPSQRLHATRVQGRAANAFDSIAWRAPRSSRFESGAANDHPSMATLKSLKFWDEAPTWPVILFGAAVSGMSGAILGLMLAV